MQTLEEFKSQHPESEVFGITKSKKSGFIKRLKRNTIISTSIVFLLPLAFLIFASIKSSDGGTIGLMIVMSILFVGFSLFRYFNITIYLSSNIDSVFLLTQTELIQFHEGILLTRVSLEKDITLVKRGFGYFVLADWYSRGSIYGRYPVTTTPLKVRGMIIPSITDDFEQLLEKIKGRTHVYREFRGEFRRTINHNC